MALWTPYSEQVLDLSRSSNLKFKESLARPARLRTPTDSYCEPDYHWSPSPPAIVPHDPRPIPRDTFNVPSLSPDSDRRSAEPLPLSPDPSESLLSEPEFLAFEREALRAMAERNGGSLVGSNPRMRRAVTAARADDDAYRRQRERNNHAAKQSRDRRKMREVRLSFQVAYLHTKVSELRALLAAGLCARCRRPRCDDADRGVLIHV